MLWSGRVFFFGLFFFFTFKKKKLWNWKKKERPTRICQKVGSRFFFFFFTKKKNLSTWGQHNIFFFGLTQKKNFQMINCGKCARASDRSKISFLWPPRRVINSWGWGGGRGEGLQGAPFFAMGVGGALPKSMGAHKLHKRKSEHRRRKVYFCGFERAKRARKK